MDANWRRKLDFSTTPSHIPGYLRSTGIPERYIEVDLDKDFPKTAKSFTEAGPGESYYICGPELGNGKTHLLCAMLKDRKLGRLTADKDCLFYPTEKLLQALREDLNKPKQKFEYEDDVPDKTLIARLEECAVLAIDDLGSERITDWTRVTLYMIINSRYNAMLPLYVTSNYNLKELADNFDPRIASRLKQMCTTIKLIGKDKRVK